MNSRELSKYDRQMTIDYEKEYTITLLEDSVKHGASTELKSALAYFQIFLNGYFIIATAFGLGLANDGEISMKNYLIAVIARSVVLFFSWIAFFAVCFNHSARIHTNTIYGILSTIFVVYALFTDQRVLCKLTGEENTGYTINNIFVLIAYLIFLREVIFFRYFIVVFLSVLSMLLYIAVFSQTDAIDTPVMFGEFVILIGALFLLCTESYSSEFRTRQLFWRKWCEQEMTDVELDYKDLQPNKTFNTDLEELFERLEQGRAKIKATTSVIMYNDVKQKLNHVAKDLKKIKKRLAHGSDLYKISINKEFIGIDQEDKKFLVEQFTNEEDQRSVHRQKSRLASTIISISSFVADEKLQYSDLERGLQLFGEMWNFDIWFIYDLTQHDITIVAEHLYNLNVFSDLITIDKGTFMNFFTELEAGYLDNPYHNSRHAADVCHSLLYFIKNSDLKNHLSVLEILASVIASCAHDVGHGGLTNRYLIMMRDKLAFRYNDQSVLENMHCALTYTILQKQGWNVFEHFTDDEWTLCRHMIIDMILQTDMSKHFDVLGRFRLRAIGQQIDVSLLEPEDRLFVLGVGLKCADIGHGAKKSDIHEKWTQRVCEEFFNQGDLERAANQQISMFCDRQSTNIAKSQHSFLTNIVMPLYEAWATYLRSEAIRESCIDQLKRNINRWNGIALRRRATLPTIAEMELSFDKIDKNRQKQKKSSVIRASGASDDNLPEHQSSSNLSSFSRESN